MISLSKTAANNKGCPEIHISGAEGIYDEKEIAKIVRDYTNRALSHQKGRPDSIVISMEEIKQKPLDSTESEGINLVMQITSSGQDPGPETPDIFRRVRDCHQHCFCRDRQRKHDARRCPRVVRLRDKDGTGQGTRDPGIQTRNQQICRLHFFPANLPGRD